MNWIDDAMLVVQQPVDQYACTGISIGAY